MSLENIEIHFRSRVSRSVNEKLAAAALVEKCCVAWRFDSWLMCQWSIENKSIFQDEKLLCFLFSYASYYRRSKLPSITHNNAHPRLDFQFRSHHLSRYHMPDFIFPFFPDLIKKHIIQSVSKKLLEKLYVKNLGKNMRLKLMFSAVTIIDCFWKSFHFGEQQVEKVLYANTI